MLVRNPPLEEIFFSFFAFLVPDETANEDKGMNQDPSHISELAEFQKKGPIGGTARWETCQPCKRPGGAKIG